MASEPGLTRAHAPPEIEGAKIDDKGASLRAPARSMRPTAYRSPGANRWRFVRAYTTTFQVIFSYVGLSLRTRFMGKAYRDARIAGVHRLNARRVYLTILSLQGLFIKV